MAFMIKYKRLVTLGGHRVPACTCICRRLGPRGTGPTYKGGPGLSIRLGRIYVYSIFSLIFCGGGRAAAAHITHLSKGIISIIILLYRHTSLTRHTSIDTWEQCNHTRKNELNRYLVN